jgi:hypothetical protein
MYITADQPTISRALAALRQFDTAIKSHRVHGRYALSLELQPEAAEVIDRAVAYCDELGAEIGEDTFLGSSGTAAGWRHHFELSRFWIPTSAL